MTVSGTVRPRYRGGNAQRRTLVSSRPRLRPVEANLRPSTAHGYRGHVDRYLLLVLGPLCLADLSGRRLQACFDLLARRRTHSGTPTVHGVRADMEHVCPIGEDGYLGGS